MGFFEDASAALDKGVTKARGAVSTVAGEQLGFVRGFARLCSDGFSAGHHERNGGNASYRLKLEDVSAMRSFFYTTPSSWVPLAAKVPSMSGEYLLVTGSGKYLRNVASDVTGNCGIVEISSAGDSWRVVWGLTGGAHPTSELTAHVQAHAVRKAATSGASRVLYHAHPTSIAALTSIVPADPKTITCILWSSLTESVIAFPGGVGAVSWKVPGSVELADATSAMMAEYEACVWALHGVFASGVDFDSAFGLVSAIDKAADAYMRARSVTGMAEPPYKILDQNLRDTALAYGLSINESFLE